jgi:hypothetical protein
MTPWRNWNEMEPCWCKDCKKICGRFGKKQPNLHRQNFRYLTPRNLEGERLLYISDMNNFILLLLTQLALLSAHLVDIVEFSTYHHVVMVWEQTKYNSLRQLVKFGRLVPRHVSAVVLLDFCCFDLDAFPGRSMRRANLKRLSESAHISRTESAHVSRTIPHFVHHGKRSPPYPAPFRLVFAVSAMRWMRCLWTTWAPQQQKENEVRFSWLITFLNIGTMVSKGKLLIYLNISLFILISDEWVVVIYPDWCDVCICL